MKETTKGVFNCRIRYTLQEIEGKWGTYIRRKAESSNYIQHSKKTKKLKEVYR